MVSQRARTYQVNSNELEVYRNGGELLCLGVHYNELGNDYTLSTQIEFLIDIDLDDVITYRIDANGGQVVFQFGSTPSLQGAYDLGNSISTTGLPVVITNPTPGAYKALQINGDLGVTGVIDPLGIEFIESAVNPLGVNKNGLWTSDNAAKDLMYERDGVAVINMTADFLRRDGTFAMTADLDMDTNKIIGLAAPTNPNDATRKTYVDTADALKLNLAGGTLSGTLTMNAATIAMGGNKITGLAAGTLAGDAVRFSLAEDRLDCSFKYASVMETTPLEPLPS